MADIQKTIEILFSGTDNVSGTIEKVGDSLSGIGDSIQDATQPFADLTKAIGGAEVAMGALVGVAIAGKADIENLGQSLQATLGITADEANGLADEVKAIFSQGFDLDISTEAVSLAFQQFRDVADENVGAIAASAVKVSEAFGGDLKQTIDATKTLTENFGLSGKEALDFIAAGFQSGLDRSGDFLESVNEYSTQFSNGGASAEQFFSLLDSGLQGGLLGTDKAADAFKEFRVRIQDGSKTTQEGLAAIGINAADMAAKFQTGSITAAEAFQLVLDGINKTDDRNKAFNAGVALLGTQFEDLGDKAAKNLTLTSTKMSDLEGAAERVSGKFDTIGQAASAAFNSIFTAFADSNALDPISDAIEDRFKSLAEAFPKALAGVNFDGLNDALLDVIKTAERLVSDFFGGVDLSTPEGLESAIQQIVDAFEGFQEVVGGVMDGFGPLVGLIGDAVDFFGDLSPEAQASIGIFLALATQANLVGVAISTAGGALSTFGAAAKSLDIPVGQAAGSVGKMVASLAGPAGLVVAAGAAGAAIGLLVNKIPGVQETVQGVIAEVDNFLGGVFSAGPTLDEMEKIDNAFFAAKQQAERLRKESEKVNISLAAIPGETRADIATNAEEAKAKLAGLGETVDGLTTDELKLAIGYDDAASSESISKAKQEFETLSVFLEDGTEISIQTAVDQPSAEKTKEELQKLVPPDKQLELQVQLDIAAIEANAEQFKAQMEALQTSVEWKAKLDIAEVEANAEIVSAAFDSINTTIQSTGDVLSGLFGLFGKDLGFREKWAIFDQIEKENELRERAVTLQEQLTQKQMQVMDAWLEAQANGEPMKIEVMADGLKPHLENILYELLGYLQEKIVLEGGDMLIPIASAS